MMQTLSKKFLSGSAESLMIVFLFVGLSFHCLRLHTKLSADEGCLLFANNRGERLLPFPLSTLQLISPETAFECFPLMESKQQTAAAPPQPIVIRFTQNFGRYFSK